MSDLQRDISLGSAIERLKMRSLDVRHCISIGAGSGSDSIFIRDRLFPGSDLLLVEAQDVHLPELERLARTSAKVEYAICAAAAEDGEVDFLASAPTGGAITEKSSDTVSLPSRSIDSLAAERGWNGSFMLKFDVHGVELDILAGATDTLAKTDLIMMEVYNFKLNFVGGKNLVFYEMCEWMRQRGLRCIDMCEPLFRPNDLALWQMQFFFARADHRVFGSNSYSAPPPSY